MSIFFYDYLDDFIVLKKAPAIQRKTGNTEGQVKRLQIAMHSGEPFKNGFNMGNMSNKVL